MSGRTPPRLTLSETGHTRTIPVIHSNITLDRLSQYSREALLLGADQMSLASDSMEMIQS